MGCNILSQAYDYFVASKVPGWQLACDATESQDTGETVTPSDTAPPEPILTSAPKAEFCSEENWSSFQSDPDKAKYFMTGLKTTTSVHRFFNSNMGVIASKEAQAECAPCESAVTFQNMKGEDVGTSCVSVGKMNESFLDKQLWLRENP